MITVADRVACPRCGAKKGEACDSSATPVTCRFCGQAATWLLRTPGDDVGVWSCGNDLAALCTDLQYPERTPVAVIWHGRPFGNDDGVAALNAGIRKELNAG